MAKVKKEKVIKIPKRQTTIHDNDVQVKPLIYKDIKRLAMKYGENKDFVTKGGIVINVEKAPADTYLSGVGFINDVYKITDRGRVLFPLKAIGVKNYLKRN